MSMKNTTGSRSSETNPKNPPNPTNSMNSTNSTESRLLELLTAGVKNLPEIEPRPHFTAQVMYQIKEQEKPRWLGLPSLVYSLVFIIFCILGFLFNPGLRNPYPEPVPAVPVSDNASDYPGLLVESQQLNLIEIQAKTFELVYNEDLK